MEEQTGKGADAGSGLDAGFDLQPVEKTLNRLSVLADISVETITGTQDITRQIFLGCN